MREECHVRAAGRLFRAVLAAVLALAMCALPGCAPMGQASSGDGAAASQVSVSESGSYTSRDEVAAYIHEFGHLPGNFVTKREARAAGWKASEGNLDEACPGKSIGGDRFYDDDRALPEAAGRTWTECDVGYSGGYRGKERIVFSNDGLVFYTGDHYRSFERLY